MTAGGDQPPERVTPEPDRPADDDVLPPDDGRLVEVTSATLSVGPLPSPEVLARYGQVSPDLVERIVAMAETQGQHRRDMERSALEADIAQARGELGDRRLGQWLGFTIATVAILAGAVVIALGHDWAGGALGVSGVAGLAAVFVRGRSDGKPEPDANE